MSVEERKQEARALEQQGETERALELCEEVLSELEGTPEIWKELPLYVKAGDLALKLNDSSNAISHYEKAANAYAAYGSSKSVIALCTKILRVNPGRTHVFLRLVRLMIERNHLADARLVLVEYATRLKLPKSGAVLAELADRPQEEMKPLLEMLLELGGRYEYANAQGRDHVRHAESHDHGRMPVASALTESKSQTIDDPGDVTEVVQEDPKDAAAPVEQSDASESEAELPGSNDEDHDDDTEPDPTSLRPGMEEDAHPVDDRPSTPGPIPRASRQVLFKEKEARAKTPVGLWIGLGSVAAILLVGLGLVLFNVIPVGSGPEQARPELLPDSQQVPSDGENDSTQAGQDGDVIESEVTDVQSSPVSRDESTTLAVTEEGETATDSTPIEIAEPIDSVQPGQTRVAEDVTDAEPTADLPQSYGVKVQDFDIESNTEFFAEGRPGFRVTQILGNGEVLTLSSVYYGDDIDSAPGSEQVTLTPLVGDTTTGIVRFNGYAVEARALVSASVLQALLNRLVEVPELD